MEQGAGLVEFNVDEKIQRHVYKPSSQLSL